MHNSMRTRCLHVLTNRHCVYTLQMKKKKQDGGIKATNEQTDRQTKICKN